MTNQANVNIKLDTEFNKPSQGYNGDFAHDLYTKEDVLVLPDMIGATVVSTGIHTEFDEEKYGMVVSPRSSISKLPISMANSIGIVEGTYRGDIGIPVRNTLSTFSLDVMDFALQYNEETKEIGRISIEELEENYPELLAETQQAYIENYRILRKTEKLLYGQLPTGTLFIPKGTRIAQAFLVPKIDINWNEVNELSDSERGERGFGSTGSKRK